MSQNKVRLLAGLVGMILITSAYHRIDSIPPMTRTATAFLASLTPEQRAKAQLPFEGDERLFWHYVPTENIIHSFGRPRMGLTLGEMTPPQKHLAYALLAAGLSQRGFIKTTTIMSLEDVLRIMEKDDGKRRNPEKYFFNIFGQPSETGTWGYRVEGHHVSLHFTIVNGKVAGSPTFLGANPAEVRQGPRRGLRALGKEEDLGRDLLNALNPEQKKVAVVSQTAYKDILTAADRKAALKGQPSGISASKMTVKQRELLRALMEEYADNLPDQIAQARMEQIQQAGTNFFFAWAGTAVPGQGHYYRVQAPTFLIEYDNTQNNANHIHSVWRDFDGDFGLDLLKAHYQNGHTR